MKKSEKKGLGISAASYVTAVAILAILMIATYVLTLVIPAGSYERVVIDGRETIVTGSYRVTDGGIPFWKWILSPILVLGSNQGFTMFAVIIFLIIIGGTFNALNRSNTMGYMLNKIVHFAGNRKYVLLSVVTLFFLSLGAFIGSFEECIPMVPLVVSLATAMGWDVIIGLTMSLGAVACGFATGVLNPFTTGIAQTLMGLPMFSGISLRLLMYVCIYGCLMLFMVMHIKRCEKNKSTIIIEKSSGGEFVKDKKMEASVRFFIISVLMCFAFILISAFVSFLSDYLMGFVALFFLVAGIGCCICAGVPFKKGASYFGYGILSILPSILLILMAGSIQYTMTSAGILDTILNYAVTVILKMPPYASILCIFAFAMIMNFFITSGSAEAVLLMPLLAPMADVCGISRQLTVLAYNFGDGFSNLLYFTNPCLLIALSLVGVSYGRWIKNTLKLQLMILLLICGMLILGRAIGY